jgi:hypothetical protein
MIFKLAEAAETSWFHRRNRGRQIASSSRCRLISPKFGDTSSMARWGLSRISHTAGSYYWLAISLKGSFAMLGSYSALALVIGVAALASYFAIYPPYRG